MFENISLFQDLDSATLHTLEFFCQERRVRPDEIIFLQWDDSNSMYIVKSWLLQAYDTSWVLWYIHPGEFVWEMSIFAHPPIRSASVKTIEQSILIILPDFSIKELGEKYPSILEKIQNIIQRRLHANQQRI